MRAVHLIEPETNRAVCGQPWESATQDQALCTCEVCARVDRQARVRQRMRDVEPVACLRALLRNAAQACELAGQPQAGRALERTPVDPAARLACVFRVLRQVEAALLASWAVDLMGPSPRSIAVEALTLAKAAAVSVLSDPDRTWLRQVERRLRVRLERAGLTPRTTYHAEATAILAASGDDSGDDPVDGEGDPDRPLDGGPDVRAGEAGPPGRGGDRADPDGGESVAG